MPCLASQMGSLGMFGSPRPSFSAIPTASPASYQSDPSIITPMMADALNMRRRSRRQIRRERNAGKPSISTRHYQISCPRSYLLMHTVVEEQTAGTRDISHTLITAGNSLQRQSPLQLILGRRFQGKKSGRYCAASDTIRQCEELPSGSK
jgi:hypothetical protein